MKSFYIKYTLLCSLVLLFFVSLDNNAQVYINEWVASNSSGIEDPDYNETADWIELYNDSNQTVDLSNYYLSDNLDDPTKWSFPSNTTIPSKSYLLIWADGNNHHLHTSFKLTKEGEEIGLYNSDTLLIDDIVYKNQKTNISMGRKHGDLESLVFYTEPTPGFSNKTKDFSGITFYETYFSTRGGIYNEPLEVSLSSIGGTIHYTLDGSVPNTNSLKYTQPIQITETSNLRASVFIENYIAGKPVTHTYFINENLEERKLPVVSISTNDEYFWDADTGLYVQDFKPEWKYPINIELFENDGSDRAAFNELAGTKVNGLNSWESPQKMLGIYFDNDYDKNNLDYQIFFDRDRKQYDNFILRASGSDWGYSLIRDGLCQELTSETMNIEKMGFRPCIVFVNGAYLGIHNMRSRIDESFIEQNFGYESNEYDLIENNGGIEEGSNNAFFELFEMFEGDLSDERKFQEVADIMDLENFTDYMITQIWTSNGSWGHNIQLWKPKADNTKWRWILQDLDRGFTGSDASLIQDLSTNIDPNGDGGYEWARKPLRGLFKNTEYSAYFASRFTDHLFTTFHPERVNRIISTFESNIETEIPFHVERWGTASSGYAIGIPSVEHWEIRIEALKTFANDRQDVMINNIKDMFSLDDEVNLSTMVNPPSTGNISINDIKIPDSDSLWNGPYFKNLPFELKAEPLAGYEFVGWSTRSEELIFSNNKTLSVNLSVDTLFIANFSPINECILPKKINQNISLKSDCSPYYIPHDVLISEDVLVQIEPGTNLLFGENVNLIVNGSLDVQGTEDNPVVFQSNDETKQWGGIIFKNSKETSILNWLEIINASNGTHPIYENAAVSAFNSNVSMDHLNLENVFSNPILTYYSDVSLKNSRLHSKITGDLINIKYGDGLVENCSFLGNTQVDTDAIDFDEVENGIIRNNNIEGLFGFNSDGIDLGEESKNILIENNFINNCTDKGISIGQRSSATIENNSIVNCYQGVAIKDLSQAEINHSTFYNTAFPVACFEKNVGIGGGIAALNNSILSNSPESTFLEDDYSMLDISNSLSDTDLILGENNLFGNPLFINPNQYNFKFQNASPAINATSDKFGNLVNLGSSYFDYSANASVMISAINYNPIDNPEVEFIEIYNPSDEVIDLTGYVLSEGMDFTFPAAQIAPKESIKVVKEDAFFINNELQIFEWSDGKLSNNGETIRLSNAHGIIIDQVIYDDKSPWETGADGQGGFLSLKSYDLDNHFAESWKLSELDSTDIFQIEPDLEFVAFPNPANNFVNVYMKNIFIQKVELYNALGQMVISKTYDDVSAINLNLENLVDGIYCVKVNDLETTKIVVGR